MSLNACVLYLKRGVREEEGSKSIYRREEKRIQLLPLSQRVCGAGACCLCKKILRKVYFGGENPFNDPAPRVFFHPLNPYLPVLLSTTANYYIVLRIQL